jgi:hypothetical protein
MQAALDDAGNARAGLDAGDVGQQHLGAAGAPFGGKRPHGGQHADGQVHHAGHVGVVVVQSVHQDAVEPGHVAQRQPLAEADHAASTHRVGERGDRRGQLQREVLLPRRECAAHGVEHQVQRPLLRGRRHGGQRQTVRKLGERLCGGVEGGRAHVIRPWHRCP